MNYSMSEKEREEVEALPADAQERYHAMRAAGNNHTGAMNHSKRNPADLEKEPAVIDARQHFGPYITTDKITGLPSVNFPSPLPIELARTIRDLPENTLRRILNSQSLRLGMATKRIIKGIMDEMRRNGASRKKSSARLAPESRKDRHLALKEHFSGVAGNLDAETKKVIDRYMESDYSTINSYLRTGTPTSVLGPIRNGDKDKLLSKTKAQIEVLDKLVAQGELPFDMKSFRVTDGDVGDRLEIGSTMVDPAFTSVTHDREVIGQLYEGEGDEDGINMYGADDPVTIFEIDTPAGTKGAYLSGLSTDSDQYEYLLARGTKFVVTSKTKGNSNETIIGLKVIK